MKIFLKPINTFSFDEIISFCQEGHIEGIQLDYKKEIPAKGLSKHFAAFSNTRGGVIIIGVEEDKDTGKPAAFNGIKNEGKIVDRLHQYAAEVQPIPSYQIHTTDEKEGKVFILIRIFEGDRTPYYVHNDANLWIRTGNISNPIDIAFPDYAEILFNKKIEAEKQREIFVRRTYDIFDASVEKSETERIRAIIKEKEDFEREKKKAISSGLTFNAEFRSNYVQNKIGENVAMLDFLGQPFYPKRALIAPADIQKSVDKIRFQNRGWSRLSLSTEPMQDGLLSFWWGQRDGAIQCEQFYSSGLYFLSQDALRIDAEKNRSIALYFIAAHLFIFLKTSRNFYQTLNYEGGVVGYARLNGAKGSLIKRIESDNFFNLEEDKGALLDTYKWNLEFDTAILNDDVASQNYFIEKIKEIYWSFGYQPNDDKLYKNFLKSNGWLIE